MGVGGGACGSPAGGVHLTPSRGAPAHSRRGQVGRTHLPTARPRERDPSVPSASHCPCPAAPPPPPPHRRHSRDPTGRADPRGGHHRTPPALPSCHPATATATATPTTTATPQPSRPARPLFLFRRSCLPRVGGGGTVEVGWGGGEGGQEGGRDPAAACSCTVRIPRRCWYGGRGAARGNATAASGAAAAAVGCRRRPLHRYSLLPLLLPTSGAAAGASTAAWGWSLAALWAIPGWPHGTLSPGLANPGRKRAAARWERGSRRLPAGRVDSDRAPRVRGGGAPSTETGKGEERGNERRSVAIRSGKRRRKRRNRATRVGRRSGK